MRGEKLSQCILMTCGDNKQCQIQSPKEIYKTETGLTRSPKTIEGRIRFNVKDTILC